jgi:hypothetical protein
MTCPYLEYRRADGDKEFDHERPYCGVTEEFVSPMKADICNDRFEFDHECDCELYKEHVEEVVGEAPADDD